MGVACTFCKKRKRKCDGMSPCSICMKYNKNGKCEYLIDQDKRKFKYDSTYVDYLEMKVDLLQQLADELIRNDFEKAMKIDPDLVSDIHNDVSMTSLKRKTDHSETLLRDLANEEAVDELISTKWRVRQDFKGHTEFYGPVSGRQKVIEDDEDETDDESYDIYEKFNEDEQSEEIQIERLTELVYVDVLFRNELIDDFEQNFADFFYISKLSINEIKSWRLPNEDISKQLLLCSILTYGSNFNPVHKPLSTFFLKESESIIVKASKDMNENYLQAVLVLSCYQLGMGLDVNSWMFDAMASSAAQYLKLDRGNETDKSTISNSLFWSIILQDRIITSVLGRGCRIQFFRITSPFFKPMLSQDDENYLSELTFANHSKLWFIYDRYLSQIYSFKADHLHKSHKLMLMNQGIESLNKFQDLLPVELKLSNEIQNCEVLIFNLSYSVAILLLYRAYLKQIPLKVIQIIIQHCEIASSIIKMLINHKCPKIPYFISYLILTCATFDLFLLTHKDESVKSGSNGRIKLYLTALLKFGKIWKRCLKDIKVLDELATSWNLNLTILKESSKFISSKSMITNISNSNSDFTNDNDDINYSEFFNLFKPNSVSPFGDDESISSSNIISPNNMMVSPATSDENLFNSIQIFTQ